MFFCQAQETGCFHLLRICRVKHARKVGSTNKVTFLKIGKFLVIPQASNVPNAEKWHMSLKWYAFHWHMVLKKQVQFLPLTVSDGHIWHQQTSKQPYKQLPVRFIERSSVFFVSLSWMRAEMLLHNRDIMFGLVSEWDWSVASSGTERLCTAWHTEGDTALHVIGLKKWCKTFLSLY